MSVPLSAAPALAPFVVGVGRSGTTLLRLMLDSHPDLSIPPETGFLFPLIGSADAVEPASRPIGLGGGPAFVDHVAGFHTFDDLDLRKDELAAEVARLPEFSLADGTRAVYSLYARRHGKSRRGDKTPGYLAIAPNLLALLPEARIVHLIRDGRDVALSLREVWFAPGRDMPTLARHWVDLVRRARQAAALDGRWIEVRYEELVSAPEKTLRALAAGLGLDFDPAMLSHAEGAEARLAEVRDAHLPDGRVITREQRLQQHSRVLRPPDPGRLGRWRSEMTSAERAEFESIAGELLEELGY